MGKFNSTDLLLVIPSALVAGTELQAVRHGIEISKLGFMVHLVFLRNGEASIIHLAKSNGIQVSILGSEPGSHFRATLSLIRIMKLLKIILDSHPKVISSYLLESILHVDFSLFIIRFFKVKKGDMRVFYSIRGSGSRKNRLIEILVSRALNRSNKVLVNANHLVDEVVQRYRVPQSKVAVIQNAIEVQLPRVVIEPKYDAVYVANFVESKGHLEFLRKYVEYELTLSVMLIGRGNLERRLDDYISESQISNTVHINSERPNIFEMLRLSKIAIHPSISEGLSNAVIEYLAIGLPVVAFDVGGNRTLIIDGVNGFLLPLGDYRGLFDKALELLSDTHLLESMSTNARNILLNDSFTWKRHTQKYLEIYEL